MTNPSPIEAIKRECNEEDTLHAVIPVERDGDDMIVWAIREQAPTDEHGHRLHQRIVRVDMHSEDGRPRWTSQGMIVEIPEDGEIADFARAMKCASGVMERGEDSGIPCTQSVGPDMMAKLSRIFRNPIPGPDTDTDEDAERVEQPDTEGMVRCERCGELIPEADALEFSSGPPLGQVWVHDGGCPDAE